MAEAITGKKQIYTYVDQNRIGDHICYYSDLRKMQAHYPNWNLTRSLPQIFAEDRRCLASADGEIKPT